MSDWEANPPFYPAQFRTTIPRAWLVGRGYDDRTARTWASRIRRAYALGVGSPGEVDAVLWRHTNAIRAGLRQALQNLDAFRRAGR